MIFNLTILPRTPTTYNKHKYSWGLVSYDFVGDDHTHIGDGTRRTRWGCKRAAKHAIREAERTSKPTRYKLENRKFKAIG